MLSIGNEKVRVCDGVTRRDFLQAGGLSVLGLSLADLVAAEGTGSATRTRGTRGGGGTRGEMNCIVLFLIGAPSHLDTFDLKPEAPAEIRGPFKPIRTNVPGIEICEHFPMLARMADKFALIRSVHHKAAPIHETGHQMMQTGWLFNGGMEYPHYGSVVSKLRGGRNGLPPYVVMPGPIGNTGVSVSHGQEAGYLGKAYDPFFLKSDPGAADFRVMDLAPPKGIDPARMKTRRQLLTALDEAHRKFDARGEVESRDSAYSQAFGLMFSPEAKTAFDIAAEPEAMRDRYGRNTFGQSCVLARRLVEKGVRLVTVNMFDTVFNEITWDCHADGGSLAVTLDDYKETLCPMFEQAYTALITDLYERGMLDNTLVVAMGEFGRTPKLNARGGRDHWPGVWSILFAGGGVRGGQVIGASDKDGGEPRDRPVTCAEVAASVYHALGVDLETRLPGPQNRPMPLVEAEAVRELFG